MFLLVDITEHVTNYPPGLLFCHRSSGQIQSQQHTEHGVRPMPAKSLLGKNIYGSRSSLFKVTRDVIDHVTIRFSMQFPIGGSLELSLSLTDIEIDLLASKYIRVSLCSVLIGKI